MQTIGDCKSVEELIGRMIDLQVSELERDKDRTVVPKPPLGVMPRWIAKQKNIPERVRLHDLLAACKRYSEVGKPIPVEWSDEIFELTSATRKST